MGNWLLDLEPDLFELGSAACGRDLDRLLRRGDAELEDIEVLQVALVAVGLAALRPVLERVEVAYVGGHSLGEFTALGAAGAWSPAQTFGLAAARGRSMKKAARTRPGGMIAVAPAAVQDALTQSPDLVVAVRNPDQVVLSGSHKAIRLLQRHLDARPLSTLGAWHSKLMSAAVPDFTAAMAKRPPQPIQSVFLSAEDGQPCGTDAQATQLANQLIRTADWKAVLEALNDAGVTDVIVAPPSQTVVQHVQSMLPEVRVHAIEDQEAQLAAMASLSG